MLFNVKGTDISELLQNSFVIIFHNTSQTNNERHITELWLLCKKKEHLISLARCLSNVYTME